jgi:WD40 repeat protein
MKTVKIFVSSPGDVRQERQVAAKVLTRLETQFAGRVGVKGYFWEHEPMHAGADFQTQIPPPAEFDVFVGILWSRLGTRLHSSHVRSDGRPYLSGSEFEFETALESYRTSATKTPRLLIYRREETPLIPAEPQEVFEERKRQWDSLQRFIQHWFTDLTDGGTFKAAFRGYHNTAEFEELLEEHLRKTIVEIGGREAQESAWGAQAPIWTEGSPYRGFKPFEFEHAAIFFGRTRAIDEVIGQLRDQVSQGKPPFVVIFGGSGSGKSSLLRAGVIPALASGGVERFGAWRRAVFQPSQSSGELFEGLATALTGPAAIPEISATGIGPLELVARLRENPEGLEMYLAGTLQQLARESHEAEKRRLQQEAALMRDQGRAQDAEYVNGLVDALQFSELRLILGLDQLEELFLLGERFPAIERKRFLVAVASLVRSKTPCVWVVATLRSDFFSKCEESEDLIQLMGDKGQYRLLPPNSNEFSQMIRFPARSAGLTFEDHPLKGRLDDVLRDTALAEDRSLPLLELTLDRLFEAAGATRLMTHEAYDGLGGGNGGLRGVLLNVADAVYADLSKEAKESFPKVFKSLTSLDSALGKLPGSQEHFSRRIVRREALKGLETGAEEVIKCFVDARLLVAYRDDEKNEVVSVAHEALLNEWVRLRSLLEHEIDFLKLRARFATAVTEWERDGRNPRRLARGLSLAEAREVLRVEPEALQSFEADYIRLSKQKRAIRLATFFGTAVLLVVIFGALALWAELSERDARRALARSNVSIAEEFLGKGEAASAIAFLANAVDQDPDSTSAGDRLWFALSQRSWPLAASAPGLVQSEISAIAFSPDGSRIVAGLPSGAVKVWDTANTKFLAAPSSVHTRRVICCVFSPDGGHFITGSIDPTTCIWDAKSGQPGTTLLSHQDSIECAAFSADSRYVGTGSRDKTVRIWDAANGRPVGKPLQHDTDVNSISFHPATSNRLVTTFDTVARIWDRSADQHQDLKHPGTVTSAQFNVTGDAVLTTCHDGFARLWSTETCQVLQQSQVHPGSADCACISANSDRIAIVRGKEVLLCKTDLTELAILSHPSNVTCTAFSNDGSRLLSATNDGKVRVWSAFSGQEIGEAIDERNQVLGADFTPDGRILLGTSTGLLRVWIAPTLSPLGSAMWHRKDLQTISVSPDEKMVLTGAEDSQARLWDLSTCTLVGGPLPHRAPVTATAFAANGDCFLTAAAERAALWSTVDQEKLGETSETDGDITSATFSPDGDVFATATRNGEARFWSVPDCKPIGNVMHPSTRSARIVAIAFNSHDHVVDSRLEPGRKPWELAGFSGHCFPA